MINQQAVATLFDEPPGEAVVIEPVTFEEVRLYLGTTLYQEGAGASAHKEMYRRTMASLRAVEEGLSKLRKAQLESLCGICSNPEKKPELVERALMFTLECFALDQDTSDPNRTGYVVTGDWKAYLEQRKLEKMQRITAAVEALTDDDLNAYRARREERRREREAAKEETERAVTNPVTLEDFEVCVRRRGIAAIYREKIRVPKGRGKSDEIDALIRRMGERELSDDELARYDELRAAEGQERRAQRMIERATIKRIDLGEGNYMEIVKRRHTKRQVDQWIVVLAEREDRTTFEELCIAARKLGGDYQRAYAPADSPGGFAFDEEEQAEKFVALQSRDVFEMTRLVRLVARRDRVRDNAIAHFGTLATRMEGRATEELTRDRLENTERRIMLAEIAREHAHGNLAMAETLRNHAEALFTRTARHLDRIRWRTHAEALDRLLDEAQGQMARVSYPWPTVGKHALKEIAQQIGERDGSILITRRILKLCEETDGHVVEFRGDAAADTLRHFYRRARLHRVRGYALDAVRSALGDFKRMRLNNLDTLPELRAALREHKGLKAARAELTKAEKVMLDLYPGQFPPDYFPTPRDVVMLMLEYADMEDGMDFAEPQAGSGHIANVVRELFPQTRFTLVELSGLLIKALQAQGWAPIQADFLKTSLAQERALCGGFDRIIMNPPFGSEGVGTDIDHVLHAYPMLKENGGRLVSLMSDGVFYRGDHKAQNFRAWLEEVGGMDFELPEGAFLNSDRPTSWAARVVVIDR